MTGGTGDFKRSVLLSITEIAAVSALHQRLAANEFQVFVEALKEGRVTLT